MVKSRLSWQGGLGAAALGVGCACLMLVISWRGVTPELRIQCTSALDCASKRYFRTLAVARKQSRSARARDGQVRLGVLGRSVDIAENVGGSLAAVGSMRRKTPKLMQSPFVDILGPGPEKPENKTRTAAMEVSFTQSKDLRSVFHRSSWKQNNENKSHPFLVWTTDNLQTVESDYEDDNKLVLNGVNVDGNALQKVVPLPAMRGQAIAHLTNASDAQKEEAKSWNKLAAAGVNVYGSLFSSPSAEGSHSDGLSDEVESNDPCNEAYVDSFSGMQNEFNYWDDDHVKDRSGVAHMKQAGVAVTNKNWQRAVPNPAWQPYAKLSRRGCKK
eukprot:764027-Hanusia_phi.AAC.5